MQNLQTSRRLLKSLRRERQTGFFLRGRGGGFFLGGDAFTSTYWSICFSFRDIFGTREALFGGVLRFFWDFWDFWDFLGAVRFERAIF